MPDVEVTFVPPVGEEAADLKGMEEGMEVRPLWTELFAVPEIIFTSPGMVIAAAAIPNGAARPVLVIPGFVAGDLTTAPLRGFLRALGHRPSGWGLGINVGVSDHIAVGLDRALQEMAHKHGTSIDIVGWSAGGLLGRLLAQHRSELVGQVISLGSPIRLRPTDHNLGMLSDVAGKLFVSAPIHINVDSVPVPSTTIWTKHDGVVPGELCKQTVDEHSEAIEVRGTHIGLGTNPAVLAVVADRLGQTGEWQPFVPPKRLAWWYPSIENGETNASAEQD